MTMEEKLVINGMKQGIELTKRLMSNIKHTSSTESSKALISEIIRIHQNVIFILSLNKDDESIFKQSHETDSKNVFKKQKLLDKKDERVYVFVGTGQGKDSVDDGHSWRKYGQKDFHGSINPRGYFRCTHRFTQKCLALKQIQKSDTDPSIFEVTYVENHTCNNYTSPATKFSVPMFEEGKRMDDVTEQVMVSLEDLENKKRKNVVMTLSFSNHENVGGGWQSNVFM
ncbi:unnamed protein product [Eruca vesicaria subsp. sativa]|uniref:WRKY domain-containing protein n=1 Tax=Eruca vesicaria subsp. sativa TaxID=29727 RepID=A0ABC8IUM3_ERUVS|nr:unnamed protein product [Eruca vesicaria subsp. sativa]